MLIVVLVTYPNNGARQMSNAETAHEIPQLVRTALDTAAKRAENLASGKEIASDYRMSENEACCESSLKCNGAWEINVYHSPNATNTALIDGFQAGIDAVGFFGGRGHVLVTVWGPVPPTVQLVP